MHWIDPAHLPETKGTVDRFLINPHGDADGMLLKDGTEVHFPPHMSKPVVAALKPGDHVKVRGVRPRGVDMVAAVSLQVGDATPIVDHGPPKKEGAHKVDDHKGEKKPKPEAHKPVEVEGVVKHVLHGPKGEECGALLDNGTIVRMPPHAAESLHDKLAPGHKLAARGASLTNALGTVVDAHEIGVSLSALHPVEPKKPGEHVEHKPAKHDEKSKKHEPAM
ncbi:MAG: hypothetical protein WAU78_02020 [Roseiarcus sp.]|jgi:hypothetical protein